MARVDRLSAKSLIFTTTFNGNRRGYGVFVFGMRGQMNPSTIETKAVTAADVIHGIAAWMRRVDENERRLFLLQMRGVLEREMSNGK